MSTLFWIVLATLVVSLMSLVGAIFLFFREEIVKKIVTPLVAFSAGALLTGALLHLIPEAIEELGDSQGVFFLVIIGFSLFFLLEQFIHWHHCHRPLSEHKQPVTYLILIADSIHNFLDGLAVGSAFVIDIRLGIVTALIVTMHEIPQELGDFGILLHGGWKKSKALLFNLFSALTMVIGGLFAYMVAAKINIIYLLPFAAGNFIYIAAADLVPEVKHHGKIRQNVVHFIAFLVGIILIWLVGQYE